MRPSWVEVDLDAITHNVSQIGRTVAPAAMCAVVKANGYGHGDVPVAEAALKGGASWLAVALLEEGIRLREAGIDAPILLLSEPDPTDAAEVVAWSLEPTVYRGRFADAIAAAASTPYPVQVKVDTGMHRVGAAPGEAAKLIRAIAANPMLRLTSVWTHFAAADEDEHFTAKQMETFAEFVAVARAEGVEFRQHAANTAAALSYPASRLDLVRVGLGMYGLRPAPSIAPDVDLRPAMRVLSQVSLVRRLAAGERPSYGRRRPLAADSTVATVPIGYADGVARRLSSLDGGVLIRGRRYPFAGAVTMDQVVVNIGDDPVAEGDEVVLLGTQDDAEISAGEWATRLGTISYEIVCDFGSRLPRRFISSDAI